MKYLFNLVLLCLFFICSNKEEEPVICSLPPYHFTIKIEQKSPEYQFFVKNGEIDVSAIQLLTNNGKPLSISTKFHFEKIEDRISKNIMITKHEPFEFFTNKKETIYLKNSTKTYKIEVLGKNWETQHCGTAFSLEEAYIDGVKQDNVLTL